MTDQHRRTGRTRRGGTSFLEGQLLIAMPSMTDKRFRRAVIYMCRHSSDGAMGLIVNHHAGDLTFPELMRQLDILEEDGEDALPEALSDKAVHFGGPVSTERGFVLHSPDYLVDESTLTVADGFCLTATVDILKAMAAGRGPRQCLLALGYSGWAPGQLESEIQANGWLHCPADGDLVFGESIEDTYERALSKIGVDLKFLVSSAGHA